MGTRWEINRAVALVLVALVVADCIVWGLVLGLVVSRW